MGGGAEDRASAPPLRPMSRAARGHTYKAWTHPHRATHDTPSPRRDAGRKAQAVRRPQAVTPGWGAGLARRTCAPLRSAWAPRLAPALLIAASLAPTSRPAARPPGASPARRRGVESRRLRAAVGGLIRGRGGRGAGPGTAPPRPRAARHGHGHSPTRAAAGTAGPRGTAPSPRPSGLGSRTEARAALRRAGCGLPHARNGHLVGPAPRTSRCAPSGSTGADRCREGPAIQPERGGWWGAGRGQRHPENQAQ